MNICQSCTRFYKFFIKFIARIYENFSQVQSVIQQPQQSVIQSTALQTVQLQKGNVIILKQQPNSVIQSASGANLHTVQVN